MPAIFYLFTAGTALFLGVFLAEFGFNKSILSSYSPALMFSFLAALLAVLLVFTARYVRQTNDAKGKVLFAVTAVSGALYVFFLIINLLVSF